MDLIRLLVLLLSSLDVLVTMNTTRGCFTPANISCNATTLSCGDNQIIDLQNIERIGMCKVKEGCVKWWKNFQRGYHVTYKDTLSIYKQCSSQQSCTINSSRVQNGQYYYTEYTYECLEVITPPTTEYTSMDTVASTTTEEALVFTVIASVLDLFVCAFGGIVIFTFMYIEGMCGPCCQTESQGGNFDRSTAIPV